MPLISVIMGVYNPNENMLKKAVDSLLCQTVSDFELIICDDGSDETTKKLLMSLNSDSRIKIITQPKNMGLAAALNRCIEAATGEYIARQDDDDYSAPDRFEKQLNFLKSNPDISFCGTDCYLFDADQNVYSKREMPQTVTARSYLFNSPFIHGSMMFRKDVFACHRYKTLGRNRKYEDYDLFMRLCADGYKAANIPQKLYYFYFDTNLRKIPFSMRTDEFSVRLNGFRQLHLMPSGFFYALKPIILGLIPYGLFIKIKKKSGKL